jgi:methionyl aminopeptidase
MVMTVDYTQKIDIMRRGGEILSSILSEITGLIKPGIQTIELDNRAMELFDEHKVKPAFLGYRGFPKSICTSINEEVVHGIPGERKLNNGDILSIDVGLKYEGYYSDMAVTVPVGNVSAEAEDIMRAGRETLQRAVDILNPGMPLREFSHGIQEYAEGRGYNVLRKYVGHTIGDEMHLEPQIPNFTSKEYPPGNVYLNPGMVIAIEPMLTVGTYEVDTAEDGWTVYTQDRKLSVHFEYSVAILDDGIEVLTCF